MLDLKQGVCKSWNIKVAEQRLFIQRLKQVRSMVYAGIETSKRDCQCKCLRIVQGLPEPGNKYNNAHLKVSLEGAFSEVTQGNKKVFVFLDNECSASDLSLSKSFALSICSWDPMKNPTLGCFYKSTSSQMHRKLQPWWLFGS